MAKPRAAAADLKDYLSGPVPDWMLAALDGGGPDAPDWPEEVIEFLADRARYVGYFGKPEHKDRLEVLVQSREIGSAETLSHWKELAYRYPSQALIDGESPREHTDDAKLRAHLLGLGLGRLLDLVEAPPTLKADLRVLLGAYRINVAEKYSQAQRALITD